jgi:anaerobic dimethyl sulfoxide reductase subunit A
MRRIGARGEGKFEKITWDEAIDIVAGELKRVRDTYGNASILFLQGSGSQSTLHNAGAVENLLAGFGGYTRTWGGASYEGALYASMATFGTMATGNSFPDLLNSNLVILWGWNPAITIWDTNTPYTLARVKEKGVRIVSIDPRLTETTATFASEWIPIRPATDTAMLIAMAYVIIQNRRQDKKFLDTFSVGFERFKSYVMGEDDGIAKTPAWAEEITGVAQAAIERLAIEYATTKPAALVPGWGPARGSMGEQFTRAASTLAAMTGNIGKEGGYAGGFMRGYNSMKLTLPRSRNLIEKNTPPRPNSLHKLRGAGHPTSARIHECKVYDAIIRGKTGGYPCDPKLAYIVAVDFLVTRPNVNAGIKAFDKLEFIVVHEQRMTPTARFADILLPVNTFMERKDLAMPWLGSPYYLFHNKAIDSLYESKSDRDICVELASKLGIEDFRGGRTDDEWMRCVAEQTGDIPDFDSYKKNGVVKIKEDKPHVSFTKQILDPENNPFPTPSGKIEIYSEYLSEMENPDIPPIPKYIPAPEGYGDQLQEKYPLQLITTHHKTATHSTLNGIPWLEELEPRRIWINTHDAEKRGISDGDEVLAFNDRGKLQIKAYVTERIMPGVVNIGHGAWFEFDKQGLDHGGCENTLTPSIHSPGGAWPANTILIEVKKV